MTDSPAITPPSTSMDYPTHECGVFAIYGHPEAALLTYYGLFALQHRGQESAGITSYLGEKHPFSSIKGMGLVSQVFSPQELQELGSTRSIGHVRYSTTGSSNLLNAQPLTADTLTGRLAIAHNGNLVNAATLRAQLEEQGAIFQTTTDSEIVLHLLARSLDKPYTLEEKSSASSTPTPIKALSHLHGAFSIVIMGEKEIIGIRDPNGFRPLCLGKLDDAWVLASETCAFDLIGATFIRDVEPGEVVIINDQGIHSEFPFEPAQKSFCIFEHVYFARPDSNLDQVNVSQTRIRMGEELARRHPVEADIVVPIPDSGIYAALGFAETLGIRYEAAFVRNHYVGRTFIQPSQLVRSVNVRIKLNLIAEAVRGKRVVVVDDSVVRGTTAKNRVVNLREAGATEVHLRISCPPHKHPCYYGIDFPDPDQLLANQYNPQEICEYLGVDSIGYLPIEGMIAATKQPQQSFCLACFNGQYPIPFDADFHKLIMEERQSKRHFLESSSELMMDSQHSINK